MPDKFVDHVTQYPRRITIKADGTDGTVNDPALHGKVIELEENFGSLYQQGTHLNAYELNRRIIGEMILKSLTEEVTVLTGIDTVEVITLHNLLEGAGEFDDAGEWTGSGVVANSQGVLTGAGANVNLRYTFDNNFNIGDKIAVQYEVVSNTLNDQSSTFRINGLSGSNFSGGIIVDQTVGKHTVIITATIAGNLLDLYIISPATSGDLVLDKVMVINATADYGSGNEPVAEAMNTLPYFDNEFKTGTELNGSLIIKEVDGLSAFQEVENGDVVSSLTSNDDGTLIGINTDGTIEFVGSAYDATNKTFNIISGNKYFVVIKLDSASVGNISDLIRFRYSNNVNDTFVTTQIGNVVYGLITASSSLLANVQLQEGTTGLFTKNEIMLIDITGEIYEDLTAEQLAAKFPNYFESVKSIKDFKLQTIGTQLFDGVITSEIIGLDYNKISNTQFSIKSTGTTGFEAENVFPNISFKPLTRYTFSGSIYEDIESSNTRLKVNYTDGTSDSLVVPTVSDTPFSFTSDNAKTIEAIVYSYSVVGGTTTFTDFMINEGITAKTHKPFLSGLIEYYSGTNEEYRSLGTVQDKVKISNAKLVKEENVSIDSTDVAGKLKAGVWAISATTGVFYSRFFISNADTLLGIDLDTLVSETTPARLWIDGQWYTNIPEEDMDTQAEIDANPYTFGFSPTGTFYIIGDLMTAAAFGILFRADYELHYLANVTLYKTIFSRGYSIVEEGMTVIILTESGIIPDVDIELPGNTPQMVEYNTQEIRRLWNMKMEAILIEDFSELPLNVPSKTAGGVIELTDNLDYSIYCLFAASDGKPNTIKPIFFGRGIDGIGIEYDLFKEIAGTLYQSASIEITFELSNALAQVINVGNAKFNNLTSSAFTEDPVLGAEVYALYGIRSMGGDPRQ